MHHLGTGRANRGKRILALLDETTATVVDLEPGEILSHNIDPTHDYWRNQRREPGRWPGSQSSQYPMSRLMCHLCRDSGHWWTLGDLNP